MRSSLVIRILAAGFVAAAAASASVAQDIKFFRIGTGGTAGTYYPIGGLIANAISNPPGSRECDKGGSCGVPGLVATAVASNGSVANINGIQSGQLESGFTQSDVAYWAYTGTGVYEGKPKVGDLRLIAQPVPGDDPRRRAQGRRHQDGRRPARASACRSTSRARARWSTRASSSRAFGITEKDIKAGVPEAQPGRRQDARRRPRRVLLRRRLSDRRDLGTGGGGRRHRARAGHRPRGRQDAQRSTSSSRPTRFPPTPTRASAK